MALPSQGKNCNQPNVANLQTQNPSTNSYLCPLIPLPVPNWASAEAQFIPNFSLHTKFFIGGPFGGPFEVKFSKFSISHHFCLGRRVSLERLLSNSRVAFDHRNRHHHHQMVCNGKFGFTGAANDNFCVQ